MIYNTAMIKLKDIEDGYGHLTPIEGGSDIPFTIKRVYYITRVEEGIARGFHSHRRLHQLLICVNGTVKIRLKTPFDEEVVELKNPAEGLYIGPMVWREMFDFSPGSVLLVLASDKYDEADYIRDYNEYVEEGYKFWGNSK